MVALEPVMVELFQFPIPFRFFETGGQSARTAFLFKDGDLMPGLDQVICGGQSTRACTDDSNVFHTSLSFLFRSGGFQLLAPIQSFAREEVSTQ